MKHGVRTKKLGRTKAHRTALLRNLVGSLLVYERIRTTLAKAKLAQRLAERLVSYGQQQTLAARRNAVAILADKQIVKKLFDDVCRGSRNARAAARGSCASARARATARKWYSWSW